MPSPAAEAHQKEMQDKFAPAEAAMLKNATPPVLYTHHVMGVYTQYDLLGRVNAVSNNHHNARPVLARLVDHALFAMKACVQAEAEEAKFRGRPEPEIADHHGIALILDGVSEAVAEGDYVKATVQLEQFMATALHLTIKHAKALNHATHGAVAGDLIHMASVLQDHYIYTDKYVNRHSQGDNWLPIADAPTEEDAVADLWVTYPDGSGERVTDCFVADGKWMTWDIHQSGHTTPGSGVNPVITHFRLAPQPPKVAS